jgi:large subunit ribosomal protein L5
MNHLKQSYLNEVVPKLMKDLGFANVHCVPKIEKVVINIGVGDTAQNAKLLDAAVAELESIVGQKPVVTRAKKSIAGFKIRQGMPIGLTVTLRSDRMYDFLAKLVGIVLPRIRDFRGLNPGSFDGSGNYNLGLKDQLVFPEINYDSVQRLRGMNITIVTSVADDKSAFHLLSALGMPFKKSNKYFAQTQDAA